MLLLQETPLYIDNNINTNLKPLTGSPRRNTRGKFQLVNVKTLLSELSNEVGFPVTNTSFDALLESLLSTAKPFPQSAGYRILASYTSPFYLVTVKYL
ncbi:hypothetical protein Tco_0411703 [Tanacetum coccineum]